MDPTVPLTASEFPVLSAPPHLSTLGSPKVPIPLEPYPQNLGMRRSISLLRACFPFHPALDWELFGGRDYHLLGFCAAPRSLGSALAWIPQAVAEIQPRPSTP